MTTFTERKEGAPDLAITENALDIFDIRKLYYFSQAANFRSFRLAAQHLGISQSNLTRSIQQLEEALAITLLVRNSTGNELTEPGRSLIESSARIFSILADTRSTMDDLRRRPTGVVTLAIPMSFASSYFPYLLSDFRKRFPDVKLRLMEGSTRHVEEWITSGRADVGIVVAPSHCSSLLEETVISDPLYVFQSAISTSDAANVVKFPELATLPLVLPLPPHGTRKILDAHAAQANIKLNCVLEVDNPSTIASIVLNSDLFAVHSMMAFHALVQDGKIVARPLAPRLQRELAIATKQSAPLSLAARELSMTMRILLRRMRTQAEAIATPATEKP